MPYKLPAPTFEENSESVRFEEFIANLPPGSARYVSSGFIESDREVFIVCPEVTIYCPEEECKREMNFSPEEQVRRLYKDWNAIEILYTCRNCGKYMKFYSMLINYVDETINNEEGMIGTVIKMGEWPRFSPIVLPRVLSLIGPDKELFLKGRTAESQGMGIGSFGYYRRVVDNQKNSLIKNISKAAVKLESSAEILDALEAAEKVTSFKRSIELMKGYIPESLLIKGHNPLTLLYQATSEGLHEESDEKCLELAGSIRIVLNEFARKLEQVLRDTTEVDAALTKLMAKK